MFVCLLHISLTNMKETNFLPEKEKKKHAMVYNLFLYLSGGDHYNLSGSSEVQSTLNVKGEQS